MKSAGFLVAERTLANHSERLARRAPEAGQLAAMLADAAPRLSRMLAEALAPLLGDERPEISFGKVERLIPAKLHKIIDPVAVNHLLADESGATLLASIGFGSALALTDLVFGGAGDAPAALPERLPRATDLVLARFADAIGEGLGKGLERPAALKPAMRSDVLGKLVPARGEEIFLTTRCAIQHADRKPWELIIALRQTQAARLLDGEARGASPRPAATRRSADAAPFGQLPMQLRAVLAEMLVPVSRISALRPGDTLPLTIARDVPLLLGDAEIARGQVGAADGMLALKLNSTALTMKDQNQ